MAIHKTSPPIVTNGLILCLDTLNVKSYIGTGTTINNLVDNSSYTMNSGITVNGGILAFNGTTNAYISLGTGFLTPNYTKSVWIKTSSQSPGNFISGNVKEVFYCTSGKIYITNDYPNAAAQVNANYYDNSWHNIVGTYNGTTASLYMDSILLYQLAITPVTTGNITYIGMFGAGSNFGSSMAAITVYNRALTQNEITQNYNAQKGRFRL